MRRREGDGVPGSQLKRVLELWTDRPSDSQSDPPALRPSPLSFSPHAPPVSTADPDDVDDDHAPLSLRRPHLYERHQPSLVSFPPRARLVIAQLQLARPLPLGALFCFSAFSSFIHTQLSLLAFLWPPQPDSQSRPGRAPIPLPGLSPSSPFPLPLPHRSLSFSAL